jgi:hypothetical protein
MLGARRLYLEINRSLANAIHLYDARADVFMEMPL